MNQFAKLFDSHIGQILVVLDLSGGDQGAPTICFTVQPPNLGLCSTTVTFRDTDESATEAQRILDSMTVEIAIEALQPILEFFQ